MDLDAARRRVIGRTLRRNFTPVQLNGVRREFLVRALRNGSNPPRDAVDEAIFATLRGYPVQPMFSEPDSKADERWRAPISQDDRS